MYSVIVRTGSYIPQKKVYNKDFLNNVFYDSDRNKFERTNEEIIEKFKNITEIKIRRYVKDKLVASDITFFAVKDALE